MDKIDVNLGTDAYANKFAMAFGQAGNNTTIQLDQSAMREEKVHQEELRPESFVMNFLQRKGDDDFKKVEGDKDGKNFSDKGLASPK